MAPILVILLSVASIQATSAVSFDEWRLEHGKVYSNELEENTRKSVYMSNVQMVESLNQHYSSSNIGFAINQFADLTPTEFRQKVLLPPRPSPSLPTNRYHKFQVDSTPPASFDWRDKSVVSNVKDQGSVGSCWAFSTVGNIEGQWALKTGHLTSLSAEQLVECDDTYDPKNLHQDCGVFGGWPYLAYSYIEKVGGIESDYDFPYCSGSGTCFPCVPAGWNNTRCGPPPLYCNHSQSCPKKLNASKFVPGLKIKDWIAVEKNESTMVNALIQQGPLSIAINAELLQFYKFGVWNPPGCKNTNLDHAVLLVGYGTQSGLFGKQPYWLIKNSWGVKWGTNGYFKMARGKGTCGVDQQVTSAVLE